MTRPTRPEPLFRDFVGAAAERAEERPAGGDAPAEEPVERGSGRAAKTS